MPCKVDHANPDSIPEFLCRACHPELNVTPDKRAADLAADRAALETKQEESRKARQRENDTRELERLEISLGEIEKVAALDTNSKKYKRRETLRRKLGITTTAA